MRRHRLSSITQGSMSPVHEDLSKSPAIDALFPSFTRKPFADGVKRIRKGNVGTHSTAPILTVITRRILALNTGAPDVVCSGDKSRGRRLRVVCLSDTHGKHHAIRHKIPGAVFITTIVRLHCVYVCKNLPVLKEKCRERNLCGPAFSYGLQPLSRAMRISHIARW